MRIAELASFFLASWMFVSLGGSAFADPPIAVDDDFSVSYGQPGVLQDWVVFVDSTEAQSTPDIARLSDGRRVIAWRDGDGGVIRGRIVNLDGSDGPAFTAGTGSVPMLLALAGGGFALKASDGELFLFDSNAGLVTNTSGAPDDSHGLAQLVNGNIVLVSETDVSGIDRVTVNIYSSADLSPVANSNPDTVALPGFNPEVAALPDGNFVVVWTVQNGSLRSVRGEILAPDTTRVHGPFSVRSNRPYDLEVGAIISNPDRGFLVLWDELIDGSYDVFSRRFNRVGIPLGDTEDRGSATSQRVVDTALIPGGFLLNFGDGLISAFTLEVEHLNTENIGTDIRPFGLAPSPTGYQIVGHDYSGDRRVQSRIIEFPIQPSLTHRIFVLANDSDPDYDSLTITQINGQGFAGAAFPGVDAAQSTSITLPSGALVSLAEGGLLYDPTPSAFSDSRVADSFTYTLSAGGETDTATVNVTLLPGNLPPNPAADQFDSVAGTQVSGNLFADNGNGADTDPDPGDTFTLTAVNGNANAVGQQILLTSFATLTVQSNGDFVYQSQGLPPGQQGQDSFTYQITDSSGADATATVTIDLTGNLAPDAVDDTFTYQPAPALVASDLFETPANARPIIAVLSSGDIAVTWYATGQTPGDTDGHAILAQIFDERGVALTDAFLVNSSTANDQYFPDITALSTGGFAISWLDESEQEPNSRIVNVRARTFGSDGTPLGPDFRVNTTQRIFTGTRIAEAGTGFVVGFSGGARHPILFQRLSNTGDLLGPETEIGLAPSDGGGYWCLGLTEAINLPNGGFALGWASVLDCQNGTSRSARFQPFDADGNSLAEQSRVNSRSDSFTFAQLSDGNFVGFGLDRNFLGVRTRIEGSRFDLDGNLYGGNIEIVPGGDIRMRSVVAFPDGGFGIVYSAQPFSNSEPTRVEVERFGEVGTEPLERLTLSGNGIEGGQTPAASIYTSNGFVAAWSASGMIIARRVSIASIYGDQAYQLPVLANDTDPDNQALTITQLNGTNPPPQSSQFDAPMSWPVTLPSGATVDVSNGLVTYDPRPANFDMSLPEGTPFQDSFTYAASDGQAGDTATVTINLSGRNDPPNASNDTIDVDAAVSYGQSVDLTDQLLANDTDPDTGETAQLRISAITPSNYGVFSIQNGRLFYTLDERILPWIDNEIAVQQLTYTIIDPFGATAQAALTLRVEGEDNAPVALDDTATIPRTNGSTQLGLQLRANDTDPDINQTETLVFSSVDSSNTRGQVMLLNGDIFYDPNGQFDHVPAGTNSVDWFEYQITDVSGLSNTARVRLTLAGAGNGFPLNVAVYGLGEGAIASSPADLTCSSGETCELPFTENTIVNLSATPVAGSRFGGWTGDCTDTNAAVCEVTMSAARSVTARFELDNPPAGRIVAATLPGARSGYVGGPDLTAFMTVVSRQSTPAQSCQITAPGSPPFTLSYRQLDGGGNPVGPQDPLFDLGMGGALSLVIALTPTTATDVNGYTFLPQIVCENATLTPIEGVNSVQVSIGPAPVPDILSIGATQSSDGVVRIPDSGNRINFMSAAAVNIGAGDGSAGADQATVTASVDTGGVVLPVTLEVCETASTGGCITPRGQTSTTSVFDQNAAKFFAVFVRANTGGFVPFDPANSRVFLRFVDATGALRSVTSAAISAPQPAGPTNLASLSGRWSVLVRQAASDWPPLRRGALHVFEDGRALLDNGLDVRRVDLTAFAAEGDQQRFALTGRFGLASSAGAIWLGDALDAQPGAFWGVRDDRIARASAALPVAMTFGETLTLSSSGRFGGHINGCAIYGEAGSPGSAFAVILAGCDQAGSYTALIDPPANDRETPVLLMANDVHGFRVNGAFLPN